MTQLNGQDSKPSVDDQAIRKMPFALDSDFWEAYNNCNIVEEAKKVK